MGYNRVMPKHISKTILCMQLRKKTHCTLQNYVNRAGKRSRLTGASSKQWAADWPNCQLSGPFMHGMAVASKWHELTVLFYISQKIGLE